MFFSIGSRAELVICYIKKLVFYCLCLGFIACGTDTGSSQSSSSLGGGSSASSSGTSSNDLVITLPEGSLSQSLPLFSLRVTDAPIDDAVKVVLTFTAIELMAGDEASSVRFTYRSPRRIDLLQLYGANTESLLDKVPLPAGEYTEIRLLVSDEPLANFIEFRCCRNAIPLTRSILIYASRSSWPVLRAGICSNRFYAWLTILIWGTLEALSISHYCLRRVVQIQMSIALIAFMSIRGMTSSPVILI